MSVVDASDSTISPSSTSTSSATPTVPATDTVGAQAQPRVMARQIPPSTARGQMQLGAPNILTDSSGQRILVRDNSSVPVVSIGNIGTDSTGNTEWGMKVAQAGVDVTTATDSQLIFNSQQDVFKIVQTGSTSLFLPFTGGGIQTSVSSTIAHGLGYVPAFIGYLTAIDSAGSPINQQQQLPYYSIAFNNTTHTFDVQAQAVISVDATYVYFSVTAEDGEWSGTWSFKYYLLQETASIPSSGKGHVL